MSKPVLVVGGGIGGLTLALALARRGVATRVLERQEEFSATGAGIQLGPNGMRLLQKLGVAERLEASAGKPEAIDVYDAPSGERLTRLPLGAWIAKRHGAPYRTAHRADLQAALLAAVKERSEIEVSTGMLVDRIEAVGAEVAAVLEDGSRIGGPIAVGADGLWSRVRRNTFGVPAPRAPVRTASRTLISANAVAAQFSGANVGLWLAPDAHIVHYPVRGGKEVAVVVVLKDDWQGGVDWATPAVRAEIDVAAAKLAPELRRFLAHASEWRKWSLFDVPPLPTWTKQRTVLIGDAAHPPLPFLAQGGVMAIEDAWVLAEAMAGAAAGAGDIDAALQRFEAMRRPRALAVLAASRRNGQAYHLTGLPARARNAVLRAVPANRLMARYDWLYGWKGI